MFLYRRNLFSVRMWIFDRLVLAGFTELAFVWGRVSGLQERLKRWSRTFPSPSPSDPVTGP